MGVEPTRKVEKSFKISTLRTFILITFDYLLITFTGKGKAETLARNNERKNYKMIEKELLMSLINSADMSDEGNQKTIKILYQIALRRIKVTEDIDTIDRLDDISEWYKTADDRRQKILYVFAKALLTD